ncbi:hypothetical protein BDK51DRAFT_29659 [Blyttiomyces helicus]|uniref:Uncharacterized protein n=1 Tax=Blyttiomyces helicus TaxID=388810 RepID=A0A4P9VXD2_9FUNG|nr:hypothetical protein BDK51DRAFT_29659 [Blyttiomyces helicus]|eukprot:RKO84364.1 hypothetical protein BDK51DRAFT_29659 [Blyttiomyces helicus]
MAPHQRSNSLTRCRQLAVALQEGTLNSSPPSSSLTTSADTPFANSGDLYMVRGFIGPVSSIDPHELDPKAVKLKANDIPNVHPADSSNSCQRRRFPDDEPSPWDDAADSEPNWAVEGEGHDRRRSLPEAVIHIFDVIKAKAKMQALAKRSDLY